MKKINVNETQLNNIIEYNNKEVYMLEYDEVNGTDITNKIFEIYINKNDMNERNNELENNKDITVNVSDIMNNVNEVLNILEDYPIDMIEVFIPEEMNITIYDLLMDRNDWINKYFHNSDWEGAREDKEYASFIQLIVNGESIFIVDSPADDRFAGEYIWEEHISTGATIKVLRWENIEREDMDNLDWLKDNK